ncbi:MAG: hypothetical protein L0191_10245, partial [Acidobacteria bacterium]|nr:hypothetical protein [Acidobacteriota bacterium]
MTVQEALDQWLETKRARWSRKTAKFVRHLCDGWARSFGDVEVGGLGALEVMDHEMRRADGKRSASALNQERSWLRMFCGWARLRGMLTGDPTAGWVYRKYEVVRQYAPLAREEEERLVAAAPGWLGRFVTVAVCTGLRSGTLRRLTWEMVSPAWVLEIPGRIIKQKKPLRLPLSERARAALGGRAEGLL